MFTEKFLFRKNDVSKLCTLLSNLPHFNSNVDVTDIYAAWDTSLHHYNKAVIECAPQVKLHVRKCKAPP